MILAPYAITESSGIVMWRYMLEPDVGMVSQCARAARARPSSTGARSRSQTLFLASVIAVWHHLPFTFLILYAALTTVPKEVLEAARIDGATAWQPFWLITLRADHAGDPDRACCSATSSRSAPSPRSGS